MESNAAQTQNPALEPLGILAGEWRTEGTHPYIPDTTLHGSAQIAWIEGGAFLIMRSHIDDERIPDGIEIFGSDDALKAFFMLHFDERGVSRKYEVSFERNVLTWQRDDPHFLQRMVLTISDDGNTIESRGEMNRDKAGWEPDLQLTYTRIS
ncbi:MAG TPA: hypothetical protein VFL98_01220 [Candidatus Paceibacterota bacterium]|nr:hypothetical protein [Candidatus Paceibacterota bacterium]